MRLPRNLLARDDITARVRASPLSDPDLPIDLFRPERKVVASVVAFDATDHAGSQILHIVDLRHQLLIRIRYQHIGSWNGPVVLVPQYVFQLIDRARDRLSPGREPMLGVQRRQTRRGIWLPEALGAEAQSPIKIVIASAARAGRQIARQVPGFGPPGAPFRCQTAS